MVFYEQCMNELKSACVCVSVHLFLSMKSDLKKKKKKITHKHRTKWKISHFLLAFRLQWTKEIICANANCTKIHKMKWINDHSHAFLERTWNFFLMNKRKIIHKNYLCSLFIVFSQYTQIRTFEPASQPTKQASVCGRAPLFSDFCYYTAVFFFSFGIHFYIYCCGTPK